MLSCERKPTVLHYILLTETLDVAIDDALCTLLVLLCCVCGALKLYVYYNYCVISCRSSVLMLLVTALTMHTDSPLTIQYYCHVCILTNTLHS
jgi:hypothetical protein